MKKSTLLAVILMCFFQYIDAQNHSFRDRGMRKPRTENQNRGERTMQKASQQQMDCFSSQKLVTNGISVNYREAAIHSKTSGKPILVIYLHGASGRGSDNMAQMQQMGIYSIYDYLNANKVNAYFAVPQCPKEYSWPGGRDGDSYVQNVKPLVEYYIKEKGVNSAQIYLFAVSMGGCGAWKLLSDYPDLFAGSLIASGAAGNVNAKNISKTPVYSTIGSLEGDEKTKRFETFVGQLSKLGDDTRFDILDGLKHGDACVKAFTTDRIAWVLSHHK